MPCADADMAGNKADYEMVHKKDSPDHENDLCSPFCQCACCTSPTLTCSDEYSMINPVTESYNYSVHLPGEVTEKPCSIFQPPKLS